MTDDHPSSQYVITHLDKTYNKHSFTCGIDALDQYLKIQAGQDIKKNVTVTYVLTHLNSKKILGYYTLSSIGILTNDLPKEIIKRLPKYPILPGILLGRLAVDKNHQGNKLGLHLLLDAFKRSLVVSQQIGIAAVIVDAKDDKAATFYMRYGLIELPENKHRLFLPLSTIRQLGL